MSAHLLRDRKTSTALSNREAMLWIPGGSFRMGSNDFYREERPVRAETVQGFWIDPYPVTNADFRKFVSATGYVTACVGEELAAEGRGNAGRRFGIRLSDHIKWCERLAQKAG